MKNKHFIPLDNDINKLVAFAPSLDKKWREKQMIKSSKHQVETLDAVQLAMQNGWHIKGVWEKRLSNRKVTSHCVELHHADFNIKNAKNQTEAISMMYLTNDCTSRSPLDVSLGAYRLVCSNGLVTFDKERQYKIPHMETGMPKLITSMSEINEHAPKVLENFIALKGRILTPQQIEELTKRSLALRFGSMSRIDHQQLLNIIRSEDEDTDLWSLYNRIQENLTQPGMIIDEQGRSIGGLVGHEDIRVNQRLFELVTEFA
jgi:hypothetical protein